MSKDNSVSLKKSRNFMYENQLSFIDQNGLDLDNLSEILNGIDTLVQWAYIIHDKDEGVEPHLHVMLKFKNPRRISSVAEIFNDSNFSNVEVWDSNFNNGLSYLCHRTSNSFNKYQYSVEEVISNFDYVELMKVVEQKLIRIDQNRASRVIEQYAQGLIDLKELENTIGVYYAAKNKTLIENVTKKLDDMKYEEFINYVEENGIKKTVIYVYGSTGTGKTKFARDYCENYICKPYYITIAGNDMFQYYNYEPCLILDELRPENIKYDDLLKMIDNYNFKMAPARRYSNRRLMSEYIVITSPYSLKQFYDKLGVDEKIDKFEQLLRRVNLIVQMTPKEIFYSVNNNNGSYIVMPDLIEENIYSQLNDETDLNKLGYDLAKEINEFIRSKK